MVLARVASRSRAVSESVDIDLATPAAYGRARIELPAGFALGATGNIGGYGGNSLTDLSVQVAYSYESVVDLGVEAWLSPSCREAGRRCGYRCRPGRPLCGGYPPLLMRTDVVLSEMDKSCEGGITIRFTMLTRNSTSLLRLRWSLTRIENRNFPV